MGFFGLTKACSVCGEIKEVFKQIRDRRGHYFYCKECYKKTMKNVQQPAMQFLLDKQKEGKKINIHDIKEMANELAKKQ